MTHPALVLRLLARVVEEARRLHLVAAQTRAEVQRPLGTARCRLQLQVKHVEAEVRAVELQPPIVLTHLQGQVLKIEGTLGKIRSNEVEWFDLLQYCFVLESN